MKLARVIVQKKAQTRQSRDRRFSNLSFNLSFPRRGRKTGWILLTSILGDPFSEVADEKHGRTGQKEPFYPSSQKGISLTTLSHLLKKKTWNDVRPAMGGTKTERWREKSREKRGGTRTGHKLEGSLNVGGKEAEKEEVVP